MRFFAGYVFHKHKASAIEIPITYSSSSLLDDQWPPEAGEHGASSWILVCLPNWPTALFWVTRWVALGWTCTSGNVSYLLQARCKHVGFFFSLNFPPIKPQRPPGDTKHGFVPGLCYQIEAWICNEKRSAVPGQLSHHLLKFQYLIDRQMIDHLVTMMDLNDVEIFIDQHIRRDPEKLDPSWGVSLKPALPASATRLCAVPEVITLLINSGESLRHTFHTISHRGRVLAWTRVPVCPRMVSCLQLKIRKRQPLQFPLCQNLFVEEKAREREGCREHTRRFL